MKRALSEYARACGGELVGADRAYSGVSTDTRTLKACDLFVALRGPRFNSNDFVTAAETAGVPKIKAPLLIQYAETDQRINEMWPAFEAALKVAGVPHQMHI